MPDLIELAQQRTDLLEQADRVQDQLIEAVREAVRSGQPKFYVARDAGVTRRTLDKWLTGNK